MSAQATTRTGLLHRRADAHGRWAGALEAVLRKMDGEATGEVRAVMLDAALVLRERERAYLERANRLAESKATAPWERDGGDTHRNGGSE